MKKSLFIILLIGSIQCFGQSFVRFSEPPKMSLQPSSLYSGYKVKYKSEGKSTIYIELKKGNLIVGNGVYEVSNTSEKVITMNITPFKGSKLLAGNDYSYILYMYKGTRNDWANKACRSVTISNVRMGTKIKNSSNMSLSNFFN